MALLICAFGHASRNLLIGLQSMHTLTMLGYLTRMNGSMVSYLLLKKL